MARIPKRIVQADIATGAGTTLITVGASTTLIVMQLIFSNTGATSINVSLQTGGVYIIKDVILPSGSTLNPIDDRLVVETTDTIVVISDTATSCDVHMSYYEIT